MRVCLGGTFHPFHAGHKALLEKAASLGSHLFVGVTDGELADRPDRPVPPVEERIVAVQRFLEVFDVDAVVRPLAEPSGPAATGDYDAIVVSPETIVGARRINSTREAAGLVPLAIHVVDHVLADDLLAISSTRIAAGDIDVDGRRLTPVRVAVGSANPVKVAAVEQEFASFLHCPIAVEGHGVESGVPEQPREDETLAGARHRATAAFAAWPEADYAVGVEAGLNQDPAGGAWYDVQACVVQDRLGDETDGWGPAFRYPDWVTKRALQGEMISDIVGPVAGDPRIGGTTGAIGYLSDGRMDRTELTRIAVRMALVPRVRRHLYVAQEEGTAS